MEPSEVSFNSLNGYYCYYEIFEMLHLRHSVIEKGYFNYLLIRVLQNAKATTKMWYPLD